MTEIIVRMTFLCVASFCASFVDSIAGGGGIISVPAFLMTGLSPHYALGTNKFAASTGSFTSTINFFVNGKINKKLMLILAPFTLIGAVLGVNTVLQLNQELLYTLVIILILSVGAYSLFSKSMGSTYDFKGLTCLNILSGIVLAFSLGFYDGFFGPGTGSFLIFGLIHIYKFDFLHASGSAKFLNFISNITSLVMFALNGRILLLYGIPAGIFMIAGARLGSKLALKKGSKLIKPLFVSMSMAAAVKLLIDMLS
ncbi:sulfite exporter TauE/SafE family protein [Clostridium thermarum]|uniref:sulfite exporter TauE/SafE family protein n=1 Tax=Clostridium thermarum TaxID=1716543 RepID=UPI0015D6704C|nr:TSUP family transporter [Clostridium thermarum]